MSPRYKVMLVVATAVVVVASIGGGLKAGYIGKLQFLLYANHGEISTYVAQTQAGRVVDLPSSLRDMTVSVNSSSAVIGNSDNSDQLLIFDPHHVALNSALLGFKGTIRTTELIGDWWFVALD